MVMAVMLITTACFLLETCERLKSRNESGLSLIATFDCHFAVASFRIPCGTP